MTNGSRRTALSALLLSLALIIVGAPSDARDAASEDTVGSLPVVGGGPGPLLPILPVYGASNSKDKGLCPACTARVVPEPGTLALIGLSLVSVGIFVRRRLLDREGESETA